MGYLKTSIEICLPFSADCAGESRGVHEQDIGIRYRFIRGHRQTMTDPAEPDSIEIDTVEIRLGKNKSIAAPWLRDLLADDDWCLSRCMGHHLDSMEDAAERAAEDRAERLREEEL